jgi:hypothetical protein
MSDLPEKLAHLAAKCGGDWPTIAKASLAAQAERARLSEKLSEANLVPTDTSVVVFGSLGRDEWTVGSDRDWTLLVDGQVDGTHMAISRRIRDAIVDDGREAGPTGTFETLAFSHDIVHQIGGDSDTNQNTTRRILLLLESRSLGDEEVRTRVLGALLKRYVGEDAAYHEPERFGVPRFLLNDYVRYWRTMAVDSARKRRERDSWAVRGLKLRISRKLIFTAGFWACLCCQLHPSKELEEARKNGDPAGVVGEMINFLLGFSACTPLETLAEAFSRYAAWTTAKITFDAYEEFLSILDVADNRAKLNALGPTEALRDPLYLRAGEVAKNFQSGLSTLFFKTDPELTDAAQLHGVF